MADLDANNADDVWHTRLLEVVWRFGSDVRVLDRSNPWPEQPVLERAINQLMTELWDNGFSQSEIRQAFEAAVADMPRYAAGEERRT